jgi:hypothetical protein
MPRKGLILVIAFVFGTYKEYGVRAGNSIYEPTYPH